MEDFDIPVQKSGPSWLKMFSACFVGTFIAGLILFGLYVYTFWGTIITSHNRDSADQILLEELGKKAIADRKK